MSLRSLLTSELMEKLSKHEEDYNRYASWIVHPRLKYNQEAIEIYIGWSQEAWHAMCEVSDELWLIQHDDKEFSCYKYSENAE